MTDAVSAARRVQKLLSRCQKLKDVTGADKVSPALDSKLQSLSAKLEQLRQSAPAIDDCVEEGEEEEEKEVDVEVESDSCIDRGKVGSTTKETPECQTAGLQPGTIYTSMLDDHDMDQERGVSQKPTVAEEAVCNRSQRKRSRSRSRQGRTCATPCIAEGLPVGTIILERCSYTVEKSLGQSGSIFLYAVRDQQGSASVAQLTFERGPSSTLGQVRTPSGELHDVFINVFKANEFAQTLATVMTDLAPGNSAGNTKASLTKDEYQPSLGKQQLKLLQQPKAAATGVVPSKKASSSKDEAESSMGKQPRKLLQQPQAATSEGVPSKKASAPQVGPPQASAPAPDVPKYALGWLKQPATSQRVAALAEEYFQKGRPQKKSKQVLADSRGFVPELLEKAPSTVQTCRSLLLFLDKKLEAKAPEKPQVGGPETLRVRVEVHAEFTGRLSSLRAPGGWDARAKRVLDIPTAAASESGKAVVGSLEDFLSEESIALGDSLKESGLTLEEAGKARREWAKDALRRDWLTWCAKLLRFQEAKLLAKVEGQEAKLSTKHAADIGETPMTAIDILEAVLDVPFTPFAPFATPSQTGINT